MYLSVLLSMHLSKHLSTSAKRVRKRSLGVKEESSPPAGRVLSKQLAQSLRSRPPELQLTVDTIERQQSLISVFDNSGSHLAQVHNMRTVQPRKWR